MKRFNKKSIGQGFMRLLGLSALLITTMRVNSACSWIVHQDKLPESAKKLRKF